MVSTWQLVMRKIIINCSLNAPLFDDLAINCVRIHGGLITWRSMKWGSTKTISINTVALLRLSIQISSTMSLGLKLTPQDTFSFQHVIRAWVFGLKRTWSKRSSEKCTLSMMMSTKPWKTLVYICLLPAKCWPSCHWQRQRLQRVLSCDSVNQISVYFSINTLTD